jgi:hypothetical protein
MTIVNIRAVRMPHQRSGATRSFATGVLAPKSSAAASAAAAEQMHMDEMQQR